MILCYSIIGITSTKANISITNIKNPTFNLTVDYKEKKTGDTLVLVITDSGVKSPNQTDAIKLVQVPGANGRFTFQPKLQMNSGYWTIYKKDKQTGLKTLSTSFFWESGDNIILSLSNIEKAAGLYSTYQFSGIGKDKYEVSSKVDSIYWNYYKTHDMKLMTDSDSHNFSAANRKLVKIVYDYIDANNTKLSPLAQYLIKSDILFQREKDKLVSFQKFVSVNNLEVGSKERNSLIEKCQFIFSGSGLIPLDSAKLLYSRYAASFFLTGLKTESFIMYGMFESTWIHNQIKKRFSGSLRDEIIASEFKFQRSNPNIDSLYADALLFVKLPSAKRSLSDQAHLYLKKNLKNYVLLDVNNKEISLSAFKGKVLLIDFWFKGCMACGRFYQNVLSKIEENYKDNDKVIFVSINSDKAKNNWFDGLNSGLYTSKNVINLNTNGKGFYHPIMTENSIVSAPTVILIDKNGLIRYFNTSNLYELSSLDSSIKGLL